MVERTEGDERIIAKGLRAIVDNALNRAGELLWDKDEGVIFVGPSLDCIESNIENLKEYNEQGLDISKEYIVYIEERFSAIILSYNVKIMDLNLSELKEEGVDLKYTNCIEKRLGAQA